MNAELIRFAQKHRYLILEGFCDEGADRRTENAIESTYENLSPAMQGLFDNEAEELSVAAGIPLDEAESALMNWILKQFMDGYQAWKNN